MIQQETENKFKERKDKIKNWLKQPLNLQLLVVMLFAATIRFYYFFTTRFQPLWWDELCYGSIAKNFISHAWDGTDLIVGETLIRPPIFQLVWSFLMRIGIGEVGARFLLEFVPSVLSVYFVYRVGKELYTKKIGIISAFVFSVLWIHLFYTARLLTNVPALVFLFSSVYYFIKSQNNEFNPKYFSVSLFLLSISTLIRYPNGIVFFTYLFFLILTFRIDIFKQLKFYTSGIIGIVPLLIFFVYNQINYGNIFPAMLGSEYISAGSETTKPIAFHLLNFIPTYLQTTFFIMFLIGFFIAVFELALGYDLLRKKQDLKSHLLTLLILGIIYAYFIFYMRIAEDRWLFATSLPLSCLVGFGIDRLTSYAKKYKKYISIILILAILIFGAYQQLNFASNLIETKKESYLQMRQGFEWISKNVPEGSVILGAGIGPYSVYYSSMKYEELPASISDVNNITADYLVAHMFSGQPEYLNIYLQENQNRWQPINVFFLDTEKQQPAVVIYKNILQNDKGLL